MFFLHAQQVASVYLQPQFVTSHSINENYKMNFGLSYRSAFIHNRLEVDQNTFLELAHLSLHKVSAKSHIGLGVLYRFVVGQDNSHQNEFRLTQQFNTAIQPNTLTFKHRIRLEERFVTKEINTRFRYRFGVDFPLWSKNRIENKFHALLNAEYLLQMNQNQPPQQNFRVMGGIGTLISSSFKIEAKIQYRLEHFIRNHRNYCFAFLRCHKRI